MEKFHFKGFSPSETLQIKAERSLDGIIERAPLDAKISATLEKASDIYHCFIEVGSSMGPFAVETSHKLASIAIDKAELKLIRKLDEWRGNKFMSTEKKPVKPVLSFLGGST